jgi:hypothetical protein
MEANVNGSAPRAPWNKGKLPGQKPPLKLREIWAIRVSRVGRFGDSRRLGW